MDINLQTTCHIGAKYQFVIFPEDNSNEVAIQPIFLFGNSDFTEAKDTSKALVAQKKLQKESDRQKAEKEIREDQSVYSVHVIADYSSDEDSDYPCNSFNATTKIETIPIMEIPKSDNTLSLCYFEENEIHDSAIAISDEKDEILEFGLKSLSLNEEVLDLGLENLSLDEEILDLGLENLSTDEEVLDLGLDNLSLNESNKKN